MILDTAVNSREKPDIPFSEDRMREIRSFMNRTVRYVFDAKATTRLARFATMEMDVVCEHAWMAVTPYPNTYIEVNGRVASAALDYPFDPLTPQSIGYYFTEDGYIYVIYGDEKWAAFTPFTYSQVGKGKSPFDWVTPEIIREMRLDNPESLKTVKEAYEAFKTYLMVGINDSLSRLNVEGAKKAEYWAHKITDLYECSYAQPEGLSERAATRYLSIQMNECAGGLRRALAGLLLLSERKHTTLVHVSGSSKLVSGKRYPIPAHNIVVIDLDDERQSYRAIFAAQSKEISHQKWHTVEGHWYHYNISKQCKHEWEPFHSESAEKKDLEIHGYVLTRHICAFCGGTRTRKPDFEKGDIKLGKVQKQYKVTASKEIPADDPVHRIDPKKIGLWPVGTGDTE